ncbi:ABC transporter permease [Paenibacillus sp. LPE1-1-1.1]|uniref:ABC transporter permease n=1 Tax=Paenibacillus sp. LPE1-1-1.1 TaxID=3135230 RepID=UPI00344A7351
MTTLISAEWYKLLRGKVLAIILACVTAQTVIQVLAQYTETGDPPFLGQFGVLVPANGSFLLQVWLSAFVGYFIASEFQNGTMRNILALGKNRTHVYLSKLLSACIAIAAIYTTIAIVATAGFSAVSGFGDMTFDEFWSFFTWNFFMQILYHLAYAAIFTMFAFLSRSLGMTIILGFGYMLVMLFFPGFLSRVGLDAAEELLPGYYISAFGHLSGDPVFVTKGIIVSAAYFVLTCIIGCIVFNKSDIK